MDYNDRSVRERQLDNDVDSPSLSLDWIWDSIFAKWLSTENTGKIFWIAGKPASGKSTLVNYVAKHEMTEQLIQASLGDNAAIAYFFFDFRAGTGIANNFEGLRRSLLRQLLSHFSIGESTIRSRLGLRSLQEISNTNLAEILRYVLDNDDRPVLLFLDGLDEYAGHKLDLVGLIKDITRYKVKVCVSSRNELPFSSAYGAQTWKFFMHEVNRIGIKSYALTRLTDAWEAINTEEMQILDDAAVTISHNSDGVFLWARFAVSDISDMLAVHRDLEESWMQSVIENMPPDLEKRYARIFGSIAPDKRRTCAIILQLVSRSNSVSVS